MTLTPQNLASLADKLEQDPNMREAAQSLRDFASDVNALVQAADTASRYIHHIGANQTEAGQPHPQQLLLDKLDGSLDTLKSFQ